jgi:hypothetical protein
VPPPPLQLVETDPDDPTQLLNSGRPATTAPGESETSWFYTGVADGPYAPPYDDGLPPRGTSAACGSSHTGG